jgi:hypothetical protein
MIPVFLVSIDDIGVAITLLAHDAARLITGETLFTSMVATTSSTSSRRQPKRPALAPTPPVG